MEETVMDKITTEMAEHICDHICGNIDNVPSDKAEEICDECKMGKFICDILNEYNKINDFDKSQSKKLLIRIAELEEQLDGSKTIIRNKRRIQTVCRPNGTDKAQMC